MEWSGGITEAKRCLYKFWFNFVDVVYILQEKSEHSLAQNKIAVMPFSKDSTYLLPEVYKMAVYISDPF